MPAFCAVVGCSKRANRDPVRFFRIPKSSQQGERMKALAKERGELWIKALKRDKDLSESFLNNARICAVHFVSGEPAKLEDRDNPDWVPSVNMGYITSKSQGQQSVSRYARVVGRQTKRLKMDEIDEADDKIIPTTSTASVELPEQEGKSCVITQTDLDMEFITKLLGDLEFANQRIYALEEKVQAMDLSEDSFKNDAKALYFTGFPKADMLFKIFESIMPYLSVKSALSPFKQVILTLMRLRLNLPFKFLSYHFAIAPSTASETFYKCIDILYAKYRTLVVWPEREILRGNMPECFKQNFGNRVAVIIDCFEIFTETPSGLLNAARCWSNYKHHSTVKFLIGITPQGTISYISEAWAGRTSDKFLTENCGFLDLIMPGDLILADRGFTVHDSVETLGANLKIPAFTKGKNQLDPPDIESTRKIANVRIHVERLIGQLKKKFKICHETIPISMLSASRGDLSALDKILIVCSAFINLCPSVVPME